MKDFTIVTAVTPEYRRLLYWGMCTWVYKPQLRDKPLIVFYHRLREKDLKFVYELYPNAKLIKWDMEGITDQKELMFSAFVFGAAKHVNTPYYMKLDADSYCINDSDVWEDQDFNYDIIGHKWGYTKPGWFIDALENYYSGTDIPLNKEERKRSHKRFESYCCLHRTDWVKSVIPKLNGKLPVPSHDTTLWFYADKEGSWGRKNIKACGVTTARNWRKVREEICKGDMAFNPLMNKALFNNIQIEIISRCNLSCTQCDRNCGIVQAAPDMELYQIWNALIEPSINLKHGWSRIDIIGGEPGLHKDLESVFDLIKIYKNKNPKCKIRFSTNGKGEIVNKALKQIPDWVSVRNSSKENSEQPHDAYRYAPVDMGETEIKACSVPWRCGIALTVNGFFPCGAGASLARVFGFDIGIKELKDVTPQAIKNQMLVLCKYCGHSNCASRKTTADDNGMSESWKKAVENYDFNKMSTL